MNTSALWRAAVWWAYIAVPITLLCLIAYGVGQQGYRQSANDTPAAMAAEAAAQLSEGVTAAQIVNYAGRGMPLQDLSSTYSPWLAIYDEQGVPLESTGQLNGAPPQPPKGVFENAQWWAMGHSWQPQAGLRFDIAVVHYSTNGGSGGYVIAGQSLAIAESHILHLGALVVCGWIFTLIATAVASVIAQWILELAKRT